MHFNLVSGIVGYGLATRVPTRVGSVSSGCHFDYSGYMKFENKNLSRPAEYGSLDARWSSERADTAKMLCDSWSGCSGFDGLNFYYFQDLLTVDTFISITKCLGGAAGKEVTGGCVPGGAPGATDYWRCEAQGPGYDQIHHYDEPPLQAKEACDEDDDCIAFTVENCVTYTLYKATAAPTGPNGTATPNFLGFHMKKSGATSPPPTASKRSLLYGRKSYGGASETTAVDYPEVGPAKDSSLLSPETGSGPPAIGPFIAYDGIDFTTPVPAPFSAPIVSDLTQAQVAFPAGTSNWAGPTWLGSITVDQIANVIASNSNPTAAYTFIDQPTQTWMDPDPTVPPVLGNSFWGAWNFADDANVTSYINLDICKPDTTSPCGVGTLLHCAGLNTSAPLQRMETYDLPAEIVSQACSYHGCHVFIENNDNTQGTMYYWPASVVTNVTVNGYFRKP
jgi:hypothetical protein